jgi:hypothetical protein
MKRRLLVALVVVALVACILPAVARIKQHMADNFVRTHSVVTAKPLNIFEWRGVNAMQTAQYGAVLARLRQQGYQTVFVASNITDAANDPTDYAQRLARFGTLLSRYHLRLGLVAGDPSWANKDEWPQLAHVMTFVQAFNATHAARISAVTFDIEPYTTGANTAQTAKALAATADSLKSTDGTVAVGFTAPFWLAEDQSDTRAFLKNVAALPHGFVTVMDYRAATAGSNGSLALAERFFALNVTHVDIFVGLDASNATPRSTTFFGQSVFNLRLAQYTIDQTEQKRANFSGQTLNDVQAFSELR